MAKSFLRLYPALKAGRGFSMTSVQQIKQQIVTALENTAVFDTVQTPPDDRRESTIIKEPAAAVFFNGFSMVEDNGVDVLTAKFSVQMKFLKIGINDTTDEIETAMNALLTLEPLSMNQTGKTAGNSRSAVYEAEVVFAGCRQ